MVIGGAAVIALGVPRSTAAVDATILAEDPEELVATFRSERIVGREADLVELARTYRVLHMVHEPSGVPVDVSLASLPFEEAAIARRQIVRFERVAIPVPRAEDLIVYKLIAARRRDLDDVEMLLVIHGETVDVARVRKVVGEFCEVLEDSSRLRALDDVLKRVRAGA